eukprot:scaffold15065_cov19-Tisochrysis_lutea.AAC.3
MRRQKTEALSHRGMLRTEAWCFLGGRGLPNPSGIGCSSAFHGANAEISAEGAFSSNSAGLQSSKRDDAPLQKPSQ